MNSNEGSDLSPSTGDVFLPSWHTQQGPVLYGLYTQFLMCTDLMILSAELSELFSSDRSLTETAQTGAKEGPSNVQKPRFVPLEIIIHARPFHLPLESNVNQIYKKPLNFSRRSVTAQQAATGHQFLLYLILARFVSHTYRWLCETSQRNFKVFISMWFLNFSVRGGIFPGHGCSIRKPRPFGSHRKIDRS